MVVNELTKFSIEVGELGVKVVKAFSRWRTTTPGARNLVVAWVNVLAPTVGLSDVVENVETDVGRHALACATLTAIPLLANVSAGAITNTGGLNRHTFGDNVRRASTDEA